MLPVSFAYNLIRKFRTRKFRTERVNYHFIVIQNMIFGCTATNTRNSAFCVKVSDDLKICLAKHNQDTCNHFHQFIAITILYTLIPSPVIIRAEPKKVRVKVLVFIKLLCAKIILFQMEDLNTD
jgi:hypothetical protein